MGHQDANKTIKTYTALRYVHRLIAHVNNGEENTEGQKIKMMKVTMKVSGLIHKREKQSDTKLTWEMFRKIYHMYSDINNKEETNASFLLTSISDHKEMSKVS